MHKAPPAHRVAQRMADLVTWLPTTDAHPLVASSVFHHEFEFIHPFADGNGRMGRLWQSLILARWHPLFGDLPVESLVHEHQAEYDLALEDSSQRGDSAPFITFMLRMIDDAVRAVTSQVTPQVATLLTARNGAMGRQGMQAALGLSDRASFRERYLKPALEAALIEMTLPEKPNSRLQRYRLTDLGRQWVADHAAYGRSGS